MRLITSSHRSSSAAMPTESIHKSLGVRCVVMFVQVNRCCVVCSCMLHSGHVGVGWDSGSILCLYVLRKGDLPDLSCASVLRVPRGSVCSVSLILLAGSLKIVCFMLRAACCCVVYLSNGCVAS